VGEPLLSAVVACYRDAPAIPQMHARLVQVFDSLGVDYEIIFVNDCSPDDADAVLSELTAKDEHVIAIEHSRNFGSQNAFVSGMQIAVGDAVILLDGDLQDPPELIAELYAKWREGYDVVYGLRGEREGSALLARLCRWFYRIFRRLSYVPIPVDAGDFGLMDRKVVTELLAFPESDQFLRGLRAWVGFKQTGVHYLRPRRPFGRSTHSWLANLWWAKKGIFSFSFLPVELLGYVAAGLTIVSVLVGGYQAVDAVRHPEVSHDLALILGAIGFFGSLNLLAVAIIGEYLIRIFEETKRRPKFIRKAIRHGVDVFGAGLALDDFLRRRARQRPSARSMDGHEG
jgi:dolichol-phosphate mannosyltransferase